MFSVSGSFPIRIMMWFFWCHVGNFNLNKNKLIRLFSWNNVESSSRELSYNPSQHYNNIKTPLLEHKLHMVTTSQRQILSHRVHITNNSLIIVYVLMHVQCTTARSFLVAQRPFNSLDSNSMFLFSKRIIRSIKNYVLNTPNKQNKCDRVLVKIFVYKISF